MDRVTGVEALFAKLNSEGRDIREICNAKIAAIGPATAEALRSHGLRVDFIPDVYDGVHLAKGLIDLGGGPALLLRAEAGSPELANALRDGGVEFREAALYRTRYIKVSIPEDLDMAVFTSASTVRAFAECAPEGWDGFGTVKAVCIGEQTARAASEAGFRQITTAAKATLESLVEAATAAR